MTGASARPSERPSSAPAASPRHGLADLAPGERAQVERSVELARRILGDGLVSMALYGSATSTGLRPDSSDIDLLIVAAAALAPDQRRAFIDGFLAISGRSHETPGDRRPLGVEVVALPAIQPWRYPPAMDLQYGEWLRADFAAGTGHDRPIPNPDLAILLETAWAGCETLAGRPMLEVLPRIPWPDLVDAMAEAVREVQLGIDENTDTTNGLLTLARILTTLDTGAIHSKSEAAGHVLAMADSGGLVGEARAALERARDEYIAGDYRRWSAAELGTARLAAGVLRRAIERRLDPEAPAAP
jgi:streptomycin 3"-adenylyltransferase